MLSCAMNLTVQIRASTSLVSILKEITSIKFNVARGLINSRLKRNGMLRRCFYRNSFTN